LNFEVHSTTNFCVWTQYNKLLYWNSKKNDSRGSKGDSLRNDWNIIREFPEKRRVRASINDASRVSHLRNLLYIIVIISHHKKNIYIYIYIYIYIFFYKKNSRPTIHWIFCALITLEKINNLEWGKLCDNGSLRDMIFCRYLWTRRYYLISFY